MAQRSGFAKFVRATAHAVAVAERERQRSERAQLAKTRHSDFGQSQFPGQRDSELPSSQRAFKDSVLPDLQTEVDDLNQALQTRIVELERLLPQALSQKDRIDFDAIRPEAYFGAFKPPPELEPGRPPRTPQIPPITGVRKFFPGASRRQARALASATRAYRSSLAAFHQAEVAKREQFAKLKVAYEQRKAQFVQEVKRRNAEIDDFMTAYQSREPEAVVAYNEMMLARSDYPAEGFPKKARVGYSASSSELIVEYELPDISVIPKITEHQYIKIREVIEPTLRTLSDTRRFYQDVIAAIALRSLHELFNADQSNALTRITFNGIVDAHDPASGRALRITLISVRASKAEFAALRLDKVDKGACLRSLGAQISSHPDELQAVHPILEFDTIVKRHSEPRPAFWSMDARPNLMEMSPTGFELLVSNLFRKMGLDTKLTRCSTEGEVDAIAFDHRPVLGGKVVIQARRFRDIVSIDAVRALYSIMLNEGANKGILVCTSDFALDAYNFSKDKPIELIDGGGLLHLLREHAGTTARIAM